MCWASKNCIKNVASEDIPVFKLVTEDGESLYFGFSYEENTEYELQKEIVVRIEDDYYFIFEGFHSYSDKVQVRKTNHGSTTVFVEFNKYDLTYEHSDEGIIKLNCVIPKGAIYYVNDTGEYVSNKIKTLNFEDL